MSEIDNWKVAQKKQIVDDQIRGDLRIETKWNTTLTNYIRYNTIQSILCNTIYKVYCTIPFKIYYTIPYKVYYTIPYKVYYTIPYKVYYTIPYKLCNVMQCNAKLCAC